jgi:hypothetical protein
MAPQFFGTSPAFFNKLLDVGSRESGDPKRGVKPGTLASMLNRVHNPQFGSSGSWLNPNQYAVLRKGGFNPKNPAIEKARQYYSSPEGQQELFNYAKQLGGVTDFRSTKYLQKTGNLLKYDTNLIPTIIQGQRQFVTPQKLKQLGATPDLSENTFFNETKRAPTKEWWNAGASPAPTLPPTTATVTAVASPNIDQRSVTDILSSSLGLQSKPDFDDKKTLVDNLKDSFKKSIMEQMIPSLSGLQLPNFLGTLTPF